MKQGACLRCRKSPHGQISSSCPRCDEQQPCASPFQEGDVLLPRAPFRLPQAQVGSRRRVWFPFEGWPAAVMAAGRGGEVYGV